MFSKFILHKNYWRWNGSKAPIGACNTFACAQYIHLIFLKIASRFIQYCVLRLVKGIFSKVADSENFLLKNDPLCASIGLRGFSVILYQSAQKLGLFDAFLSKYFLGQSTHYYHTLGPFSLKIYQQNSNGNK